MIRAIASAAGLLAALSLLVSAACGGDDSSGPTPSPTPSVTESHSPSTRPSPTPSPAPSLPDFLRGVEVREFEQVPGSDLPSEYGIVVETGCVFCDGPPTGLVRVYAGRDRVLRSEVLYSVVDPGLPVAGLIAKDASIAGIAMSEDASDVVIAVCRNAVCGGVNGVPGDHAVELIRSTDGGITWLDYGSVVGMNVVALVSPGRILLSRSDEVAGETYSFFPDGEVVTMPAEGWYPEVLPGGEVAWRTQEGTLVHSDGSPYFDFLVGVEGASARMLTRYADGSPRLVTVSISLPGTGSSYLVELDEAGVPAIVYEGWVFPTRGVPVSDTTLFSNASLNRAQPFMDYVPAIVDLAHATISAVSQPFLDAGFPAGRNGVVAVQRGPFARVVNTGSCLNVRSAPNTGAEIRECAADSVLLCSDGATDSDGTNTFLHVFTPAGVEGWASAAYLER